MKESIFRGEVEIVYDRKKRKLRARHGDAWVRFPVKLRIEGARYVVDELRPARAGSWIACGGTYRIDDVQSATISSLADAIPVEKVRELLKPTLIRSTKSIEEIEITLTKLGRRKIIL